MTHVKTSFFLPFCLRWHVFHLSAGVRCRGQCRVRFCLFCTDIAASALFSVQFFSPKLLGDVKIAKVMEIVPGNLSLLLQVDRISLYPVLKNFISFSICRFRFLFFLFVFICLFLFFFWGGGIFADFCFDHALGCRTSRPTSIESLFSKKITSLLFGAMCARHIVQPAAKTDVGFAWFSR